MMGVLSVWCDVYQVIPLRNGRGVNGVQSSWALLLPEFDLQPRDGTE